MARKQTADSRTSSGLPTDDAELLELLKGRVRRDPAGRGRAVVEPLADDILAKERWIIEIMQEIKAERVGGGG